MLVSGEQMEKVSNEIMKELTPRMSLIIDYILAHKQVAIRGIAKDLGLSMRQVRYDLEKINRQFESIVDCWLIETNNRGEIIVQDTEALMSIHTLEHNNFKHTKEDRIKLLMIILALHIERLNINELSRRLNVSRTTIKNDLEEIQKTLLQYHIVLDYDKQFYFSGSFHEKELYFYRLSTIRPLEYMLYKNTESVIEKLIYTYIVDEKMNSVKPRFLLPLLQKFFKEHNITLKDTEFYWFCNVIYLYIWYIIQNEQIPFMPIERTVISDIDLKPVISVIEKKYRIQFSDNSIYYLEYTLSLFNEKRNSNLSGINDSIISFIFQLLLYFEKHGIKELLYKDEQLLQSLYNHLFNFVKKKEIYIPCEVFPNTGNEQILDDILYTFCQENKALLDLSDEHEQTYLKLHLLCSLNRLKMNTGKKVLIVSGMSSPIVKELKTTLEHLFEIQITDVISRFHLPFYENIEDIDILLFTEEAPMEYCKRFCVINIHPILNEADIVKLHAGGISLKKHNIERKQEGVFTSLMESWTMMDVHYALVDVNQGMIEMREHVYISFQLTHNDKPSVIIDEINERMWFHVCSENEIGLLVTMFQLYILSKDNKKFLTFCKKMHK